MFAKNAKYEKSKWTKQKKSKTWKEAVDFYWLHLHRDCSLIIVRWWCNSLVYWSQCWFVVVNRLRNDDCMQAIFLLLCSSTGMAWRFIYSTMTTTPINRFINDQISWKCITIQQQQLFATLSFYQFQFSIVQMNFILFFAHHFQLDRWHKSIKRWTPF